MSQVQLPPLPGRAFGDLIEALPIAAAVCAADGTILSVNSALITHIGGNQEQWAGQAFGDLPLAPIADGASEHEMFVVNAQAGATTKLVRTSLPVEADEQSPVAIHLLQPHQPLAIDTLHPLAAMGGRPQGIDRESGVLDRSSVAHVLHGEVARCRRYGNPLAVVALDLVGARGATLDGDESLTPAAVLGQMLADQTRWADSVGRWTEQRFLLVLPETSLQSADRLVKKIKASVADMIAEDIRLDIRLAAAAWGQGDDARALVGRAEKLMQPAAPTIRLVAVN